MNLPPTFQPTSYQWTPHGPVAAILEEQLSCSQADSSGGMQAVRAKRASSLQAAEVTAASADFVWPDSDGTSHEVRSIPGLQAPPLPLEPEYLQPSFVESARLNLSDLSGLQDLGEESGNATDASAYENSRKATWDGVDKSPNGHATRDPFPGAPEAELQEESQTSEIPRNEHSPVALKISSPAPLTSVTFKQPQSSFPHSSLDSPRLSEIEEEAKSQISAQQYNGNGNGHENGANGEEGREEEEEEIDEEEAKARAAERELQDFLEQQYAQLTRKGKDATLDGAAPKVHDLMAIESFSAVLQLSTPFTGAVCNKYFRLLILLLAVVFLFWFSSSLFYRFTENYVTISHLRFTPLELRDAQREPTRGGRLSDLGGLFDGCKVAASSVEVSETNVTTAVFSVPVRMNGWFVVTTAEHGPDLDAVFWRIEGSRDGQTFEDIGSDGWRLEIYGGIQRLHRYHSLPSGRGERYDVFIYPSWPWFLRVFGLFLAPSLGLVVCAVLGAMKREKSAKTMLLVALSICSVMVFIAGAAFTYMGEFHNSFLDWAFSVLSLGVAYLLLFHEMVFVQAFVFLCVMFPCFTLLDEAAQTKFKQPLHTLHYTFFVGCVAVAFLVAHATIRHRWRARKERLLEPARVELDRRWAEVLVDLENQVAMQSIANWSRTVSRRGLRRMLQQRCRPERTSALPFLNGSSWLRHPDGNLPVTSLDQLYTQASGARFLLEDIVMKWAVQHGGLCREEQCEPSTGRASGKRKVSGSDLRRPSLTAVVVNLDEAHKYKEATDEGVKFVQLKPPRRAVEKGLKLSQGDLSQLLDICRGRIVFDCLSDMAQCLETIVRDPDVHVVEVRNLFHINAHARYNGGLRTVKIQLRVITSESILLGVASHICELTLGLRAFDELDSPQFHRRVLAFRDAAWWSMEVSARQQLHRACLALCNLNLFQQREDDFRRAASAGAPSAVSSENGRVQSLQMARRSSRALVGRGGNGLGGRSLSIQESSGAESPTHARLRAAWSMGGGADNRSVSAIPQQPMSGAGVGHARASKVVSITRRDIQDIAAAEGGDNTVAPPSPSARRGRFESSGSVRRGRFESSDLLDESEHGQSRQRMSAKAMSLSSDRQGASGTKARGRSMSMFSLADRSRNNSFEIDERAKQLEDMTPADWTRMILHMLDGLGLRGGMLAAGFKQDVAQGDRDDGHYVSVSPEQQLRAMRLAMLIQQFRHAARTPAKLLDLKTKDVNEAMAETSSASVFHTSMPVAAALSKPWFQAFLMLMSVLFFYLFMRSALYAVAGLVSEHKVLRFTALELRDATQDVSKMNVVEFGGLFNGCKMEGAETTASGSTLMTQFPSVVTMNGWWMRVSETAQAAYDPVRFLVEGSDDGVDFENMGASSLFISDNGEFRFSHDEGREEVERRPGAYVLFDYVLPWQFLFRMATVNLDGCITLGAAAIAGVCRRHHLGKGFIVLGTTVASVLFATTAIGYSVLGKYRESVAPWMFAGGNLMLAWFLALRETFVMQQTILVGCCFALTATIENTVIDYDPVAIVHPLRSLPFTGVILILLGITIGMYRHRILQSSAQAIQNDQLQYEAVWADLMSRADDKRDVFALKLLVAELPPEVRGKDQKRPLRQSFSPGGLSLYRRESSQETFFLRLASARSASQQFEPGGGTTVGTARSNAGQNIEASSLASRGSQGLAVTEERRPSRQGDPRRESGTHESGGFFGGPHSPSNSSAQHRPGVDGSPIALSGNSDQDAMSSGTRAELMEGGRARSEIGSVRQRLASASAEFSIVGKRLRMRHGKDKALSLDTLFAQAAGAQVELDAKVRAWALECGGLVELLPSSSAAPAAPSLRRLSQQEVHRRGRIEFVKLEDALADEQLAARMKQGKLKGWKRAIEKLLRCYQGDVGRLLDVSRSSMVLERPADVIRCLQIIMEDPEIELVRIQNRLDPKYDSNISAGYRDVGLNLQIKSEWTSRLGIDGHVCELQLLLREFAELKHDEGHKHYVEFRNMRGC